MRARALLLAVVPLVWLASHIAGGTLERYWDAEAKRQANS